MKLVTWNCNGALRKKLHAFAALNADLYVIQECEDPAKSQDDAYRNWASNALWTGTDSHRGLAVVARPGIRLVAAPLDPGPLQLFLPCWVADGIPLLAVWTKQANSPTFKYIGQLWKYLAMHPEFLRHPQAILAGDLNSNARWDVWDRWWNHSDVVQALEKIGLLSAYHASTGEAQGKESTPTFYLQRNLAKAYHIDYAFMAKDVAQTAQVHCGTPADWLALSDHMPLVVQTKQPINPRAEPSQP